MSTRSLIREKRSDEQVSLYDIIKPIEREVIYHEAKNVKVVGVETMLELFLEISLREHDSNSERFDNLILQALRREPDFLAV